MTGFIGQEEPVALAWKQTVSFAPALLHKDGLASPSCTFW